MERGPVEPGHILQKTGVLWSHTKLFRRDLRQAKQAFLTATIDRLRPDLSASEILRLLRPLTGPTNPRKSFHKALPMVRQADGSLCSTVEEAHNRWIDFFTQMEGGSRMSHSALRDLWRANLEHFSDIDSTSLRFPLFTSSRKPALKSRRGRLQVWT